MNEPLFRTMNPATGEVLKSFETLTDEALALKIDSARQGFLAHKHNALDNRCLYLNKLSELLLERKLAYAELMSLEMGKPLAQGLAEIEKCAWLCRYFATQGPDFLQDTVVETEAKQSYISYEPIGVVLAVMPWNFPFWQVFRFAAPALLAGNAVLLKHAPNVPQCALAIEALMHDAGWAPGLFQNIFIDIPQVEQVIQHPYIQGVTLTGSVRAGSGIAAIAGREIKKCVLELGGSDAFIVLPDADLAEAAKSAAKSRMNNNGQTCLAAKRFIVHEAVYDTFLPLLIDAFKAYVPGEPSSENTVLGPLARIDLVQNLERQVNDSLKLGAELLLEGGRVGDSLYYKPVLLGAVKPGMPAYHEELFGPVGVIFKVKDELEAIQLANDTEFGLGASLWTHAEASLKRVIPALEVGAVMVNDAVHSDPRLPFGGVKKSGFGRELAQDGLREFVNIKSVVIRK